VRASPYGAGLFFNPADTHLDTHDKMAVKTTFTTQPNYLTVLTLAQAKEQLRIPSSIDDDDAIHTAYINVAGEQVMQMTGRVLAPCNLTMFIDSEDIDGRVRLPYSPLTITEVAYLQEDGSYVAAEATDYKADTIGKTPSIELITPPQVSGYNVVRITATAGFASNACPQGLVHAMRLLVVHYDENRSQTIAPVPLREIPQGIYALVNTHRNEYFV